MSFVGWRGRVFRGRQEALRGRPEEAQRDPRRNHPADRRVSDEDARA